MKSNHLKWARSTSGTESIRSPRSRSSRSGRVVLAALAVPTALALLTGCGVIGSGSGTLTVSGTAAPVNVGSAGGAAPATSSTTTSGTKTSGGTTATRPAHASGAGTSSSTTGCPAGGPAVLSGAHSVQTADLDGDGKLDRIWLADQPGQTSHRILGVETASGARFQTAFSDAAPESATAVAGRLGDGSAVILLDFTRETKVYAVANCLIVPVRNAQGVQYTFDQGFTGYGSGAGCPSFGSSGRHLVGYLAKPNSSGSSFRVTRTFVDLSDGGRRAANGSTSTLGVDLPASSSIVKTAQQITCGTGGRALEPQS